MTGSATGAGPDPLDLMDLPEAELTPRVRSVLHRLLDELNELRGELAVTQSRLAEMERLADEDALAPISNRRAFLRELARAISHIERYGSSKSLLYFDVNGMKAINDAYGHPAGDAALVHVALVLRANIRSSDLIGRLGGDEFGVLLIQADRVTAWRKADALAAIVARTPFIWQGRAIPLSVAYGACEIEAGMDPAAVIALADREMYANKRAGKGGEPDTPLTR
jgi:diguanylate cyclase (GGDEF)-like protein